MSSVVNGAAAHPMKEGWRALRQSPRAALSYRFAPRAVVRVAAGEGTPGERALRNDAASAYAHALQWVVTGDKRHSAKAAAAIDAWSATLVSVEPTDPESVVQDKLEVAWYAPIWLNAAEILRHCVGSDWPATNVKRFEKMVALFRDKALAWEGSNCCPNQAISVALSRVSIGVYTDDRAIFQSGLQLARDTMLDRALGLDGEVLELGPRPGRNCSHAGYNIEGLIDVAEVAWHQRTDFYDHRAPGEDLPRLLKGVEYLSRAILSEVNTSEHGPARCPGLEPNSIEIAFNHYTARRDLPMPETERLLRAIRPVGEGTSKFIPWDTLTHADLDGG